MRELQSAMFTANELEPVDGSRVVVLASGGPLMTVKEIRTAGEFGVDVEAPAEALCVWKEDSCEPPKNGTIMRTCEHWFDVRLLRMLVTFDMKLFTS